MNLSAVDEATRSLLEESEQKYTDAKSNFTFDEERPVMPKLNKSSEFLTVMKKNQDDDEESKENHGEDFQRKDHTCSIQYFLEIMSTT